MTVLFAAIAVADLPVATQWYSRLFGRDPDVVPNQSEVMWRVCDGGWVYVLLDSVRAGKSLATIAVEDLEQTVAEVVRRGITPGAAEPIGTAGVKAMLVDPDGNQVALIEVAAS